MAKNGKQLDRQAYAEARAHGLPRSEAAKAAGSRATRVDTLSRQGARLEAEEAVVDMIREAQAENAEETRDVWRDAVDVAHGIMMDAEAKNSDRLKAVDLFAKIGGHYAPEKHEHTINTLADLLEEVGEVGDSDA